ncbi:hypothetical protein Droror1_Dr00019502 [Drosera rotundifolia]
MGAANSKIDEDKALQLCRERKKFVRQALDGRCSLAADHVAYIQSLKSTGAALKRFVQPEGNLQSSLSTSRAPTPEPFALTEKSSPMLLFSSPTRGAAAEYLSHSPSPPNFRHYQVNHMKFRGSVIRQVEEKLPTAVRGIVTSSSTPQSITSRSIEGAEKLPLITSAHQSENPPWDYFGLFEPADSQFPSHEHRELANTFDKHEDERQIREDEGIPELEDEDEDEKVSSKGRVSQDSEDEFDEPTSDTLVRSFQNLNQHMSDGATVASPTALSAESATPRKESVNGNRIDSPKLSPLRAKSSDVPADIKMTTMKDEEVGGVEHKVAPKNFFHSVKDVEYHFTKASDSGKEVPRMLEANKFHYRPIIPGKERGSIASIVLKACLSCGKDRSHIQEEAAQNTMKYLTWHRTTSSRSSSSRNPIAANPRDDAEDISSNVFESSCMISGSHASTLDRLYAWERKLYDEVKASQIVRRDYDTKCKLLRLQESKGESSHRIDKTRADVKDLHSRIRVAILRIDSISKRIEKLRDQELQPQLEELIEGLRRMWETMRECHNLQLHVVSIANSDYHVKIFLHPESHHEVTTDLKNQLGILSSSFTRWVSSQKSYVQAINNWLLKSVSIPPNCSKKKSRFAPPPLREFGPIIFTTCSIWLEKLEALPTKEVTNAIKGLAAETSRFLPSQEKGQGKKIAEGADPELEMLNGEEFEDRNVGYDHFRSSLINFLSRLCTFADASLRAYGELQTAIEAAKKRCQDQSMAKQ